MLDYKTAIDIFRIIEASKLEALRKSLLKAAIRYVNIRFEAELLSFDEKLERDNERTIAHNAFISTCDVMARNMANAGESAQWRQLLTTDRKIIGDFACYIVAFVGVKNR